MACRFIVAVLLVEALASCRTVNQVRDLLKVLPSGLQDTYKLTMKRIFDQDEEQSRLAVAVLSWVYFSRRRLRVRELQHAVSFQLGMGVFSEDDVLGEDCIQSACAGLISFVRVDEDDADRYLGHGTVVCQSAREPQTYH